MITGYYILDRALKDKQVLVDYTKKNTENLFSLHITLFTNKYLYG